MNRDAGSHPDIVASGIPHRDKRPTVDRMAESDGSTPPQLNSGSSRPNRDEHGERLYRWQYEYPPRLADEAVRLRTRRLVSPQERAYIASRSESQAAADWVQDWFVVKDALDDYIQNGPRWLRFTRDKGRAPAWAIAARRSSEAKT